MEKVKKVLTNEEKTNGISSRSVEEEQNNHEAFSNSESENEDAAEISEGKFDK